MPYDFSRHVVTEHYCNDGDSGSNIQTYFERLVFQRPETITGRLEYIMIGSTLVVKGDFGGAVFQWYPDDGLSLCCVSTYSLGYFSEKCVASDVGTGFYEWSSKAVQEAIDYHRRDLASDELKAFDEIWSKIEESDYMNPDDWSSGLSQYWCDLFDDPEEWYDVGYRPHIRCEIMLVGLVKAFDYVKRGKDDARRG